MRNYLLVLALVSGIMPALAQTKPPNILVIWGDDIGWQNVSAYGMGTMGYTTPNIDRIGMEGIRFTDHYAQPSCTAGRASFITGQYPIRSGMTTVGQPGDPLGLQAASPCLAEVMKGQGYATGHFGKNHLGDRDEHLPTAHGFDEFYGILYHLNAGEYPEQYDFPKDMAVQEKLGLKQRGIIHSKALGNGKQDIKDLGDWGMEKQKVLDQEVLEQSKRFIREASSANKPFFVWHNTTRMHYRTNLSKESDGATGYGIYADGMKEMDDDVGELLALLKELGQDQNTIVMFSTDNGPHHNSWPDGGMTPFRSEKNTNWEGAFRIPLIVRWPGKIKAGTISTEIVQHHDWFPTFLEMAGENNVVDKLKKGYQACGRTYKNHIDGMSLVPYLTGKAKESPRNLFVYISDDAYILAIRYDNWKVVFMEQRCPGTLEVWAEPFVKLRGPKLFNLRTDPYEFAPITSNTYWELLMRRDYILLACNMMVAKWAETFKDFPPVQKPNSFTIDDAINKLSEVGGGG